jgi:hypothetical protein
VAPKEKSNIKGREQLQRRLKNTRKSAKKLKTTRKNITKKEGWFDSLKMTSRERSSIEVGSRTRR